MVFYQEGWRPEPRQRWGCWLLKPRHCPTGSLRYQPAAADGFLRWHPVSREYTLNTRAHQILVWVWCSWPSPMDYLILTWWFPLTWLKLLIAVQVSRYNWRRRTAEGGWIGVKGAAASSSRVRAAGAVLFFFLGLRLVFLGRSPLALNTKQPWKRRICRRRRNL